MKLDRNTILFNAGGGLAVLIVGAYFVRTALFPDSPPACGSEYSNMTQLPLEREGGDLFTSGDLQARLSGRDYGVLENTRVVRADGQKDAVLEVSLPKGSLSPRQTASSNKGGVAFQWRPTRMEQASAACLSYSVFLPTDFDFKRGGTLPGLYGVADGGRTDDKVAFATRYMWRDGGKVEMLATLPNPNGGDSRTVSMEQDAFRLPRGQWVKLDQEVLLNAAGRKDGAMRIWVDGNLVIDRKGMNLRDTDSVAFAGVQADVHYGGTDVSFQAPKDTRIQLTPFVVRTR
jgi:hypothetical protein